MTTRGQLTQQEIDALLAGANFRHGVDQTSSESAAQGAIQPLDVARLEHIVRGPMPTMELVNHRFRQHLHESLGQLTGRRPAIESDGVTTQKYGAFLNQLAAPANCSIMSISPLRGQALVVCDQALVFALVDALFGGTCSLQPRLAARDFSGLELRVIKRLESVIAGAYGRAWRGILPLAVNLLRSESQPQFANVADVGARVLTTSFQLEIGDLTGAIHVCLPLACLEPVRELMRSGVQGDYNEGDQRWADLIGREIPALEVTLDASFAPLDTTLAQLLAMKVGDFIGMGGDRRVDAAVDGVALFDCLYGTRNAKHAIRIVKSMGEHDAHGARPMS